MACVELALRRVGDARGKWTHVPSGLMAARVPSRDRRLNGLKSCSSTRPSMRAGSTRSSSTSGHLGTRPTDAGKTVDGARDSLTGDGARRQQRDVSFSETANDHEYRTLAVSVRAELLGIGTEPMEVSITYVRSGTTGLRNCVLDLGPMGGRGRGD